MKSVPLFSCACANWLAFFNKIRNLFQLFSLDAKSVSLFSTKVQKVFQFFFWLDAWNVSYFSNQVRKIFHFFPTKSYKCFTFFNKIRKKNSVFSTWCRKAPDIFYLCTNFLLFFVSLKINRKGMQQKKIKLPNIFPNSEH